MSEHSLSDWKFETYISLWIHDPGQPVGEVHTPQSPNGQLSAETETAARTKVEKMAMNFMFLVVVMCSGSGIGFEGEVVGEQ